MEKMEIWKDVPNYEGLYQVSNLGNVKSMPRMSSLSCKGQRFIKERPMKQNIIRGYFLVGLCKNGLKKHYSVHQLMAICFLDHTPNRHVIVVDHINSIKTDNRLCNLQLITNRQNVVKDIKNKTSKYTGVSWSKQNKNWRADIKHKGIRIRLGHFNNEKEASQAYNNYLNIIT